MMILVLAIVTGAVFAMGTYMLLRRSISHLIIGFILLSHAVNLIVFLSGNVTMGASPAVPPDGKTVPEHVSDPVPQALILTAIVISFGLLAFSIVLMSRIYKTLGTGDVNEINNTEKI